MTTIMGYPISALTSIFPPLSGREFHALAKSIKERGLLTPIALWRGQVIDGRHRLLACREAGVEPVFKEIPDDDDPLEYVMDYNDRRRHMNESQRALAAYGVWEQSSTLGDIESANLHSYTLEEAASLFRVSRRLVVHAGKIIGKESTAIPEIKLAVEQGIVAVSDASRIVDEAPKIQRRAFNSLTSREVRTLVPGVNRARQDAGVDLDSQETVDPVPPTALGTNLTLFRSTVADLAGRVKRESVDVIITYSPNETKPKDLADLAAFAAHALTRTGVMVVLANSSRLPEEMKYLKHKGLEWICQFSYHFQIPLEDSGEQHWVQIRQYPLLVYGKSGSRLKEGYDVIDAPVFLEGMMNRFEAIEFGMPSVVKRFVTPGQVVCNRMLRGASGLALAVLKNGCHFVGADAEETALNSVHEELAREEGTTLTSSKNLKIIQSSFVEYRQWAVGY